MKGLNTELMWEIIVPIIVLALILSIIFSVFFWEKETSFLNLPEGVWISLNSADTKTFVLPPVVWFGEELKISGSSMNFEKVFKYNKPTEFIFPANNVYIESIGGLPEGKYFNYAELLEKVLFLTAMLPISLISDLGLKPTLTFHLKTIKLVLPNIAFYPLITDSFSSLKSGAPAEIESFGEQKIYYLNPKKSFGKVNLDLTINLDELHIEGEHFDRAETFIENNVNLSIEYFTDKIPEKTNIFGESIETKKLKDLIKDGVCKKENELVGGVSISGLTIIPQKEITKYKCSFNFEVAEECCPTYININPIFKIKLTDKKGYSRFETLDILPIPFFIVYYLDTLNNRDFIFENFIEGAEGIQDNLFYDAQHNKPGPVEDILIYPCRAKATDIDSLLNVKDWENKNIDWSKCKGENTEYIELSSGWFCKENITVSTRRYYLYNPYAYCRLDGYELPSVPKPVYLKGLIPFHDVTKKVVGKYEEAAWYFAKYMIDPSIEVLSPDGGGNIVFPKELSREGVDIKFEFIEE